MGDIAGVKAGDKLYVRRGYHDVGRIETVDRVTPSGRVVVRYDTYEINGRLRGRGGAWIATTAERATQEHIDKVAHAELAGELSRYAKWDEHSLATLRSVKAILAQGIEARRAETALAGSVNESPVAESDAP